MLGRELLPVLLVLTAAAVLRVVYLLQYRSHVPYFGVPLVDSGFYDAWAQRVASGEGYGAKPFYMAPLYPYLLALVYKIAGHRLVLVYAGQALLGLVNLFLVYILGRRTFGHRPGLIAMVLLGLYAPLMFLESKLLTETVAVTLGLASTLLLMRALDRPVPFGFLAAGVLLGISAVCRANALITLALVVVWLLLDGRRRARLRTALAAQVVPLLTGVLIAVLPVTARNLIVGHDFAPLSTNGGIVFAQANNAEANGLSLPLRGFTGSIHSQQEEEMAAASRALGHPVGPSESSSYWFGEGFRYVSEAPGSFLRLTALKALWSLHNGEAPCTYNVYFEKQIVPALRLLSMPVSALLSFGLLGIVCSLRKTNGRDVRLLALTVLSVFLSLLIFSVSSRYRAPAAPPLAVFAAFGLCQVVASLRGRDWRAIGVSALLIVPVFLVSLVPYPRPYITSEAPANLGTAYFMTGQTDKAVEQLEKAVEMDPGFAYAHLYLGRALAKQGDRASAIEHYQRALDRQPENADAHYYLAGALSEEGRPEEAIGHFEQVVRLAPEFAEAHFRLGVQYDSLARYDDAIREYRAAVRIRSDYGEAYNNLAVDLYTVGRYPEAWEAARHARQHGCAPHPEFIRALTQKMPKGNKQ